MGHVRELVNGITSNRDLSETKIIWKRKVWYLRIKKKKEQIMTPRKYLKFYNFIDNWAYI